LNSTGSADHLRERLAVKVDSSRSGSADPDIPIVKQARAEYARLP
jgi:hypothetical protein